MHLFKMKHLRYYEWKKEEENIIELESEKKILVYKRM